MASKSAESEAMFERSPIADIEQEKDLGELSFWSSCAIKEFQNLFALGRQKIRKCLL